MKKSLIKIICIVLIILLSVISLYPFYTMVIMSTYKTEQIFTGLSLLPGDYFGENLKVVMENGFLQPYMNSFLISISAVMGALLTCSMMGYALTVFKIRFRKFMLRFVILTMMFPFQVGIIGYMIEMRNFHLTGTLLPLILYWFGNGFGAYWMTQFIQGALPRELIECARIDGCNEFIIYIKIALPCIRAGIATLALLIFLWSWNAYMIPLVLVNKKTQFTIPLYVRNLCNEYMTNYGAQIVGLVLATIPLIIMFIVGSKNFIKGLTAGAVKG